LLGQGGWEDEDFDLEHKKTDQRRLHFNCPFCQFSQALELSRLRPDNFHIPELRGSYSGLAWDTNETKRPGGKWDFPKAAATAHIRCYHCDARILDTPERRRQLADSYHHVPTNPGAPADHRGFQWPAWASMRIPLGDIVTEYLIAKQQSDDLHYRLPLQEFWQKHLGLMWSDSAAEEQRAIAHEPYDIHSDWPEEAYRALIVDCQRDLAKFWYSVFAISKLGEVRELARSSASSWAEIAAI